MKRKGRKCCDVRLVAILFAIVNGSVWGQTAWKNAANGVWSDDNNWTAGTPSNNNATVGQGTGSYTVTVDSAANAYVDLTITNAAGNTTTLDINTAGFRSAGGKITVGRGAIVNVNATGEWNYEGTNTLNNPFVSIANGGEIRINGGAVLFTNLQVAGSGQSQFYVGDNSTGRLAISSGQLLITPYVGTPLTNATVLLKVGHGANGFGVLDMSGGTVNVVSANGAYWGPALAIAPDAGSRGVVNVTGGYLAQTQNLVAGGGNFVTIAAGSSASGTLYAAGTGTMRFGRRFFLGSGSGAQGYLTVDGNANVTFLDNCTAGGDSGGTGTVTVLGGKLNSANFTLGSYNGGSSTAAFNLFGGWADLAGQATTLGYGRGSGVKVVATLNLTNGLLTTSYGGAAPTMAMGSSHQSGNVIAVMNISGSAVWTNVPPLIVGYRSDYTGSSTGIVNQTGGHVFCHNSGWQNPGNAFAMGFGGRGGWGEYHMSGGTFISHSAIYVGGSGTPSATNMSYGLLKVTGGYFGVTNTLYVGAAGTGVVTVANPGTLKVSDLYVTNDTSTLRFECGDGLLGTMIVTNELRVGSGAKLEVDLTGLQVAGTHKLVDCKTRTGSFATGNITVKGGSRDWIDQSTEDIYIQVPMGTFIMIR